MRRNLQAIGTLTSILALPLHFQSHPLTTALISPHHHIHPPTTLLHPLHATPSLQEEVPKAITSDSLFNIVLTHCTSDFDSLASAVGLAKLWSQPHNTTTNSTTRGFQPATPTPTFVILPRGAHPGVLQFLALHKHLFPIRSLRSLPSDLSHLNRLGLVDAQRRERIGPAAHLISYARRVTIVDHHIDGESDIPEATDYVVEEVGSVSTMVVERLKGAGLELSEAEATLLALGIHADTGSLCYDSTTERDAKALAWVLGQGASQAAISEHAKSSLSREQQGVLTNTLVNTNSTVVYGVTISTVLLSSNGYINGLAAVAQDALELSSSDIFILCVVYDPKKKPKHNKGKNKNNKNTQKNQNTRRKGKFDDQNNNSINNNNNIINSNNDLLLRSKVFELSKTDDGSTNEGKEMEAEAWKGGEEALRNLRLRAAFDKKDIDGSGSLDRGEIKAALLKSGVIFSEDALKQFFESIDMDTNGKIDFEEFVTISDLVREIQTEQEKLTGRKPTTMTVIGRVKAGVKNKDVNLNKLFQKYGGGGHAKAASCTVRLNDESEAGAILQNMVDETIETSLVEQPLVGDFMTSPVLSANPKMTEVQVEDLFSRYDVRALPVVDDDNNVIGLVTYKEVAAAKQRLWNKEQKRIRQIKEEDEHGDTTGKKATRRGQDQKGNALKGWMKQHIQVVEGSRTMEEVKLILLDQDVGCMPVVEDGTKQLIGMVTRTDLLRQYGYYPSLHYHNKGYADSIAARKPIIELRKKLKKFDLDE